MNYEIGDDDMFVGQDEVDALLGLDDDDYDVGAMRRLRRGPGGNALARATLAKRVRGGAILREAPPTKARQYPLSIDSVATIAAGATSIITTRPQVIFRPERLVVGQAIAPSFLINDLRVGKNSQFVNAGSVPAEGFSHQAQGVRLKCDTAQVGSDIVVSVTNTSGGALRFTAMLIGDAVE